jgi:hypothetical protein
MNNREDYREGAKDAKKTKGHLMRLRSRAVDWFSMVKALIRPYFFPLRGLRAFAVLTR